MVKVTDLPNEVLRKIFKYILNDANSPQSVFEAMRACRLFRDNVFGLVTLDDSRIWIREDQDTKATLMKIAEKEAIRGCIRRLKKSRYQIEQQDRLYELRGPALEYKHAMLSEIQAEMKALRRPYVVTLKPRPSPLYRVLAPIRFPTTDSGRQPQNGPVKLSVYTTRLGAFGTMGY